MYVDDLKSALDVANKLRKLRSPQILKLVANPELKSTRHEILPYGSSTTELETHSRLVVSSY